MPEKNKDPILEMYIFECTQLVEQLEQLVLQSEEEHSFFSTIDGIFRNMHTIKGNSAMMLYNNIALLAHAVEDLFAYLRQVGSENIDFKQVIELVLASIDFLKNEFYKLDVEETADGDSSELIMKVKQYLSSLQIKDNSGSLENKEVSEKKSKQFYIAPQKKAVINNKHDYTATVTFEEGCEMENVRAFTVLHKLRERTEVTYFYPEDIIENNLSADIVREEGFIINFVSDMNIEELKKLLSDTAFLKNINISEVNENRESRINLDADKNANNIQEDPLKISLQIGEERTSKTSRILSVNVEKLDELLDLVGELVIAEAMVTKSPELKKVKLEEFYKSARNLRKVITNIQDTVMNIRMVPLNITFKKMQRLIRDMSTKLDKEVRIDIYGENTEVDKNIIEHIGDPLMHIIRNSIDHGIESSQERVSKGKAPEGKIILEAKNFGGDVVITVKDDGKGLDKFKIYEKAANHGITDKKIEELTDKEIYSFIFLPGFSTKDSVTEYSGRGVGMDVAIKNIEKIRGSITIDSKSDEGTTVTIKIPLTLAIIEGMNVIVGKSSYIIPTSSIKECIRVKKKDVIKDPHGDEMIWLRGECLHIMRIYEYYDIQTEVKNIEDGVLILIEEDKKRLFLFADAVLGEQQVVVKTLPAYIKKVRGISGCTLLGDGSISMIIDVSKFI